MNIDSQALTTCEISADGQQISLGFVDAAGQPAALKLPVEQVGALAMTLPALIERALRMRFGDDSLRYTYPLGSWSFEHASDSASSIVTLRTADGFSVCFSMQPRQQDELGEALAAHPVSSAPQLAN
ncbi:hypothetical protein V1282_002987 [Nitrobacteraceae bacterium AZCC 2146]